MSAGESSSPRSTNSTSSGHGSGTISAQPAHWCMSATNFSSRSVSGVASTSTRRWCATAGLSAGSMPMTGMSGKAARSGPMAALVAVLQAMTAALMPRSYSRPMTSCVRRRTSATGRTP